MFVIPFSREIAAWTPVEFIDRVLVDGLHARHVVVGANFRFGARASGDVATLVEAGRERDFDVEGIALDGGPQVWSSTYVRTCLAAGDVEGAAEALGRPYSVVGHVVEGDHRGRELGYPTANVPPGGRAAPADGVYAGWLTVLDEPGERSRCPRRSASAPTRPSTGERDRRVEAYVLDRTDLELYGEPVEIAFVSRIRGMVKFEGVDALVETMAQDVVRTRELLAAGVRRTPATDAAGRDRRRGSCATACPTSCPSGAPASGRRCGRGALVPFVVVTVLVAAAARRRPGAVRRGVQLRPGDPDHDRDPGRPLVRPDRAQRPAHRHLGAVADLRQPARPCCR